jgi:hypothetical protein
MNVEEKQQRNIKLLGSPPATITFVLLFRMGPNSSTGMVIYVPTHYVTGLGL